MKEPTLVILAAGLGSRYGGLKQIDTVGSNGESIIDFSIYDAYKAGFRKLVLIIRKEHAELFDEHIANKVRGFMDVKYAFQDINDLPEGFKAPKDRTKPWGTVQALLCTKDYVDGPFMIINADDFYGKESYKIMYDFLTNEVADDHFGMVGYQLNNTLTDNGSVTRALSQKDGNGDLEKIVEYQKIIRKDNKPVSINSDGSETELSDGICSMNFWGFTKAVYPMMEKCFVEFLKEKVDVEKSELVLPTSISDIIDSGQAKVKVMSTTGKWFGVTYPEDKPMVKANIQSYKDEGVYPFNLWEKK